MFVPSFKATSKMISKAASGGIHTQGHTDILGIPQAYCLPLETKVIF
jgi:hypothetical protein